jgi:4-alpha-glucanotransferase
MAGIVALWKTRLAYAASLFDLVRLDHARGFYLYGSIDRNDAGRDAFLVGPGMTMLSEIVNFTRSIGLDLFVEDSGDRTIDLRRDLTQLEIPGMKIFRYALTTKGKERYFPQYAEPHSYPNNSVAVTTTHDTETLLEYLATLTTKQKQKLSRGAKIPYAVDDRDLAVHLRHALIDSPAETVLIPIQDWLLTTDRINIPGTEKDVGDPNWRYVLETPVEELPTDRLMS